MKIPNLTVRRKQVSQGLCMVQLSSPPYVLSMIVPLEDSDMFEPGREVLVNMRLRSDAPPADLSVPSPSPSPSSILQKNEPAQPPVVLEVGQTLQI